MVLSFFICWKGIEKVWKMVFENVWEPWFYIFTTEWSSLGSSSSARRTMLMRQLRRADRCTGINVQRYVCRKQGRNEVRWRPGQETSLAPPYSNLRSFESKSAVEESTCDIVRTSRRLGNCAHLLRLWAARLYYFQD